MWRPVLALDIRPDTLHAHTALMGNGAAVKSSLLEMSPQLFGRCAGFFYLVVVVATIYSTVIARGTGFGQAAGLLSAVSYVVVSALFYHLFKPVSRTFALLAAFLNIEGIAHQQDSLAFFGSFCLVTGYLIYLSTFLPRVLGILMILAGLGLLTNELAPLIWPSHPRVLSTIAWSLDGVGELSLTAWLLIFGVNPQRWRERAGDGSPSRRAC